MFINFLLFVRFVDDELVLLLGNMLLFFIIKYKGIEL